KDPQYPDYPTEKNAEMLDLIIKTSSNEGSIVLDCFCGSGTTLKAAQLNNRQWIGIDKSDLAIQIAREKIDGIEGDLFSPKANYNFLILDTLPHLTASEPQIAVPFD
ncbi:MAG: site-specific DNA-methyltransferase, partial [Tannerella sp.]|nr:site-specific DNA-methyltransferase [Tannerella sp.]